MLSRRTCEAALVRACAIPLKTRHLAAPRDYCVAPDSTHVVAAEPALLLPRGYDELMHADLIEQYLRLPLDERRALLRELVRREGAIRTSECTAERALESAHEFELQFELPPKAAIKPLLLRFEQQRMPWCGDAEVVRAEPGRIVLRFSRQARTRDAAIAAALYDVQRDLRTAQYIPEGPTPQDASIAAGMYALDDQEYVRAGQRRAAAADVEDPPPPAGCAG